MGIDTAAGRATSLALAAITTLALGTAAFHATRPGADLVPSGTAGRMVHIVQGNESILWTSLGQEVSSYVVRGWPSQSDGNDLGGGLVIEKPADSRSGVIDFGEKPMSLTFDLAG